MQTRGEKGPRSNNELQEVSRGHSTVKTGRTEPDYHGQRRELAIAALRHFSDALAAGGEQYRRKVYGTIAGRYHADNRKHSRLEPYSRFDKPYRLRGDNKALAEEQGKAVALDRLAIRAVSVLFTAHWRDNITVQSYYFGR